MSEEELSLERDFERGVLAGGAPDGWMFGRVTLHGQMTENREYKTEYG